MTKFPAFIYLSDDLIAQFIDDTNNEQVGIYTYEQDEQQHNIEVMLDTALNTQAHLVPCTDDSLVCQACFALTDDDNAVIFGLCELLQLTEIDLNFDHNEIQAKLAYKDEDVVCFKFSKSKSEDKYWGSSTARPYSAEEILIAYGGIDGADHKDWVINQALMVNGIINYAELLVKTTGVGNELFSYTQNVGIAP